MSHAVIQEGKQLQLLLLFKCFSLYLTALKYPQTDDHETVYFFNMIITNEERVKITQSLANDKPLTSQSETKT